MAAPGITRSLAQSQPLEPKGKNHCPGITLSARLAHLVGILFPEGTKIYYRHIYWELILGLIMQLSHLLDLWRRGCEGLCAAGTTASTELISFPTTAQQGTQLDTVTAHCSGTSGAPGERWA